MERRFTATRWMVTMPAGFFVAATTQSAYGGSLTDPNGIAVTFGPLDANLVAFSVLFCLIVWGVALVLRRDA